MTEPTDRRPVTVALDGPAGAGKSSVARHLAQELGYVYIDTGAMYRAVALYALREGLQVGRDDAALGELAGRMRFGFRRVGEEQRLFVDGQDVEAAVRDPQVGNYSSPVSAIPAVREHLVAAQRLMARGGGVVMEGRDIGTVVLPQAQVKIFLTASEEERARRRRKQLTEQGVEHSLEQILADQRERDARDSQRAVAPLRQAEDAVLIVNDHVTRDQTVARIAALVREAEARAEEGEAR